MADDFQQHVGLIQSLPVAAFACDHEGRICGYNEQAVEIFGRAPDPEDRTQRYCASLAIHSPAGEPIPKDCGFSARAIETGELQAGEVVLTRADGAPVSVLASSQPVQSANGEIVGAITTLTNISSRRETEQRLQRLSEFQNSVIHTAAEGICVFEQIGPPLYKRFSIWNRRMVEMTGYTMDEVNQRGWYPTMVPSDDQRESARRCMNRIREGEQLRGEELTITRKDGQQRRIKVSTSSPQMDGGRTVIGMVEDVTEESRYKEALQASETRLKLAMRATQLGLYDWNVATDETYYSPEWKRQLGLDTAAVMGSYDDWRARLHPDDEQRVVRKLHGYVDGIYSEYDLEFRMRHEDGSYRWIYTRGSADRDESGKATRMYGCHVDITNRKRDEDTLRHILEWVSATTGEEFFAKLVDYLREVSAVDVALVAELISDRPGWARVIAVSSAQLPFEVIEYELRDTPCDTLWDWDGPCHYDDAFNQFPDDPSLTELGIRAYLGIPLRSHEGTPTGILALLHRKPIESVEHAFSLLRVLGGRCGAELDRVRAEAAVRQSEHRLSSIAATVPQAIYVFNLVTEKIEYINRIPARELGYQESELREIAIRSPYSLIHPEDARQLPELLARWESVADHDAIESRLRLRHKSGEWRWFVFRDTVYERDPEGRVVRVIGLSRDITQQLQREEERRKLEVQVQRSQKLESLGVLAGGIAHDFNNLLAALMSFADLALMSVTSDSEAARHIQGIVDGVKSASELTNQMLAYSGRTKFDIRPLNLSALIHETSRLLQVSISKNCELQFQLDDSLPPCEGDAGQLRQVIMNLIINGSEALGSAGGTIQLTTRVLTIEGQQFLPNCTGDYLRAGDYVCLEVNDDGCGMDEETCQKIFDPFFTTKFSGRGLGMSAVLGIVRGHGGAIQVESQSEKGTTFRILLPVAPGTPPSLDSPPHDSAADWTPSGTLLVVDDEEQVLKATTMMLRKLGFEVVTASSGQQAVELFAADPSQFHAVLLDLTMPGMNGHQACQKMRELRGDTPVVLMSGYSAETAGESEVACQATAFLQKPFRAEALRCLLHDLLSAERR